jgi:hypothetical protein
MACLETRREAGQALEETALGVDDRGQFLASTVTESHAQNPSQVPALLAQVDHDIERFIGDGMLRPGASLRRCCVSFPESPSDRPAPQGCRGEQPGRNLPDATRWAYFGERRAISLETDVGLLCAEPR